MTIAILIPFVLAQSNLLCFLSIYPHTMFFRRFVICIRYSLRPSSSIIVIKYSFIEEQQDFTTTSSLQKIQS